MINRALLEPRSIVVVGGSNDTTKPGGKLIQNLLDGRFPGPIYVVNPKETFIQGLPCVPSIAGLPPVDLAIFAISAIYIPEGVKQLAEQKGTRAFIVISAGFSEESQEGRMLEKELVDTVNRTGSCLIGPNCTGVLTPAYHGVFTRPIPRLVPEGCDFISGSGATACFIMENGIPKGLRFASMFSVGNSAQIGVEEVLEYLDENFDPETSSKVKILYLENLAKPGKLLKHAASLIRKGCRIAAVKAGSSEAGSRAASSHTGALASSDLAVETLFRKAGIVRCQGREELINVASVFMHPPLKGKRIGIITHAGGPAVMLTDALSREGFEIPHITHPKATELLSQLFPGSSVGNPIDFLATGTKEQLGTIIDYTSRYFDNIDGMAVIFGTPGLTGVSDVYALLDQKMKSSEKPIFPILPSVITARKEIAEFLEKGRINFPDEVLFARALGLAYFTPQPGPEHKEFHSLDRPAIRDIIEKADSGYLEPAFVKSLLEAAGIPVLTEKVVKTAPEAIKAAEAMGYPVVMKVVGPVHKSDVGGVRLNLSGPAEVNDAFMGMQGIPGMKAAMIQPMVKGIELFAGLKAEKKFGHLVLCGLGGIYIEVMKDFTTGLAPLTDDEAMEMLARLKSYPILKGIRGQKGIQIKKMAAIISRLSLLAMEAPEIIEADLNPVIGDGEMLATVDARIKVEKSV